MTGYDTILSNFHSILIVDDNPQNLQVLGKILQDNKFEIEFATNGIAALDWLKAKKFDLVLLDVNMPGMSGFDVCSQIRSNPDMNNIPVIFLSAESERESILKGFEIGAQDYITKPFDSRELLVRARTHIKLKESLEKLEKFNKSLEEIVRERTQQLEEANEILEGLNLKLMDLDKAKSDFLNLISHEIRTPLNGIVGPLELLKESKYGREIRVLVEILDVSVRRLERFALDALLITILKTKQIKIQKSKILFSNLINEVLAEAKNKMVKEKIKIKRNKETLPAIISGEPELIKKCISNILDNAIRFSPNSGTIEISVYDEGSNIICEIKDQGKGFSKGVFDQVFELFTTDEDYKDNSIGIGLPIAKMIMEAHDGSIKIGNQKGSGAFVKMLFKNVSQYY